MGEAQNNTERSTPSEVVKSAHAVTRQEVKAGVATQTQVLIGEEDGAPNFSMRRFIMGEGGGMPRHTNTVEHEQYVLGGWARVGIGEKVYDVKASDVLYIPAGASHFYQVIEAPFEFLCVVPNTPDRLEILDDEC
jgi:quercetin dioxygenase-like cupin family protein